MEFSPGNWFKQLFGFYETPDAVQQHITCNNRMIASDVNHKSYDVGELEIQTVSSFTNLPKRGHGTFNIIIGNRANTEHIEMVDALAMQSVRANDGATYQAASNFNALEFASCRQSASDGVTCYAKDRTQGPYIALACPQSAVYRNYFCKHPSDPTCVGQLDKELNLLSDTPIHVVHGYPMIGVDKSNRLKGLDFDWSNEDNYHICVHKNCPVLMTRGTLGSFKMCDKMKLVANHVYVAAFNFNKYVVHNEFTDRLSTHMLTAEYKATVLAAWENSIQMEKEGRSGAKKLYLTLIGGGVFNNPSDVIANAILRCEELIVDSGLEVYLVCYSQNDYRKIQKYLDQMVVRTGGHIVKA